MKLKGMNLVIKRIFWLSIAAIIFCSGLILAEERPFTADRHKKANITCSGCHGEEQPKTAATQKGCITCHKSLEAVAERTKDFEKNPHKNHLTDGSDIECTQCHQSHKADVVICTQCHSGMVFEKKAADTK